MENLNLHKQKLYALIFAGVALIALILPWATAKGGMGMGGGSSNGLRSWGFVALLGIIGVVAATFLGDKTKAFEGQFRQIALASFAAIAGGALIYLLRLLMGSKSYMGYKIKFSQIASPGFGLFICLLAGAAGLLFLMGLIKMPEKPAAPKS